MDEKDSPEMEEMNVSISEDDMKTEQQRTESNNWGNVTLKEGCLRLGYCGCLMAPFRTVYFRIWVMFIAVVLNYLVIAFITNMTIQSFAIINVDNEASANKWIRHISVGLITIIAGPVLISDVSYFRRDTWRSPKKWFSRLHKGLLVPIGHFIHVFGCKHWAALAAENWFADRGCVDQIIIIIAGIIPIITGITISIINQSVAMGVKTMLRWSMYGTWFILLTAVYFHCFLKRLWYSQHWLPHWWSLIFCSERDGSRIYVKSVLSLIVMLVVIISGAYVSISMWTEPKVWKKGISLFFVYIHILPSVAFQLWAISTESAEDPKSSRASFSIQFPEEELPDILEDKELTYDGSKYPGEHLKESHEAVQEPVVKTTTDRKTTWVDFNRKDYPERHKSWFLEWEKDIRASRRYMSGVVFILLLSIAGILMALHRDEDVKWAGAKGPTTETDSFPIYTVEAKDQFPVCKKDWYGVNVNELAAMAAASYKGTKEKGGVHFWINNGWKFREESATTQIRYTIFESTDDANLATKVYVVSFPGTQDVKSVMQDAVLFMDVTLVHKCPLLWVFQPMNSIKMDLAYVLGFPYWILRADEPYFFQPGIKAVEKLKTDYPDAKVIVTGHSLGGFLSKLVGAKTNTQSISFAGPGLKLFERKFKVNIDDIRKYTYNIHADYDGVHTVGGTGGAIQPVDCPSDSATTCHFLSTYICTLRKYCGDEMMDRKVDWSANYYNICEKRVWR